MTKAELEYNNNVVGEIRKTLEANSRVWQVEELDFYRNQLHEMTLAGKRRKVLIETWSPTPVGPDPWNGLIQKLNEVHHELLLTGFSLIQLEPEY